MNVPQHPRIVARVECADGVWRDVYEEPSGRQFVHDPEGEAHGVGLIPADIPLVVEKN